MYDFHTMIKENTYFLITIMKSCKDKNIFMYNIMLRGSIFLFIIGPLSSLTYGVFLGRLSKPMENTHMGAVRIKTLFKQETFTFQSSESGGVH